MTAQQAPHTPLWRKFLSLPHTRLGWWAVGLASFVLIVLVPGEFIPARALASVGWVRDALEILGLITVLVVPLVAGLLGRSRWEQVSARCWYGLLWYPRRSSSLAWPLSSKRVIYCSRLPLAACSGLS
jgi:hypothetical protein